MKLNARYSINMKSEINKKIEKHKFFLFFYTKTQHAHAFKDISNTVGEKIIEYSRQCGK